MLKVLLLGLVDIFPMAGYDLMKVFETSMIFYWHATHTQIYNTLKEMEKQGLVFSETVHQVASPTKKVFSITEAGKKMLNKSLLEEPRLPGIKHDFLVKMSFLSKLPDEELIKQLNSYELKLKEKLSSLESEKKHEFMAASRSANETALWEVTFEYGLMYFRNELAWVGLVRKRLSELTAER